MALAPLSDITTSIDVVESLLREQAPSLADLPVTPLAHGWDNDLYRIGDTLIARLPRRASAVGLLENEVRWLPTLEASLTVRTPQPVLFGTASTVFPHPWSVLEFIPGRPASEVPVAERTQFAGQLADVLWSLHTPAPVSAPVNPVRGGSLAQAETDARVRARLDQLAGRDADLADALRPRWESWLQAADHDGVDVWLHGDLHPHNMIVGDDGRLIGVVDWGDITRGDPACDLASAWLTFDEAGRQAFFARAGDGVPDDDATRTRARAWALHLGLVFSTMSDDDPRLEAVGRHALEQLAGEPISLC